MAKPKKKTDGSSTIAMNRKARHEYFIEDTLDAGLVLQGWEVKSIRDGRVQLQESYVILRGGEAFLFGSHITPLKTASTHIDPDPTRTRKLLLHRREIGNLIGIVDRKGQTVVPLKLYWNRNNVKLQIGIAKGKKQHDKRATERERDWNREKSRIMKNA